MDAEQVKLWEGRCVEEQPPACVAACPLHLDVRAMMGKTAAGDFAGAFAVYARFIPFPAIVAHVCDHPCEASCRRAEAGGGLAISALERACVEEAHVGSRRQPQRNRRPKRVAVVGAGLAGLAAAHDLALKGHAVTVFEADAHPLERLHRDFDADRLPPSAIAADLGGLAMLGVEIRCRSRIGAGDGPLGLDTLLEAHDAVLLALGPGPALAFSGSLPLDGDGRIAADPATSATVLPKVFSTGRLLGSDGAYSPIRSVHDGRRAGESIERFLQGASLTAARSDEGAGPSSLHVNIAAHGSVPPVVAADPSRGFDRTEAMAEAARCFPCRCLECVKACDYLAHHGSYPKRYVREIYNNDGIVMGNRKSNRMIDGCTLCGQCAEICPTGLDMGEVCLDARRSMVARDKMPPSHHDFALRAMAFARSPAATLARHRPGRGTSAAVFFPGCQLTASAPDQVVAAWDHLDARLPGGVGLMLDCCGAPAEWAGRVVLHAEVRASLAASWEALGRPRVITACSTCLQMFTRHHPEIAAESLWTVLAAVGLPDGPRPAVPAPLAIHDPCTTRGVPAVQRAVRGLAATLGVEVVELGGADLGPCCGFGGLAEFADRPVADRIVARRIGESALDYLAYCATCRDVFARAGKRTLHLGDLIFAGAGADPAGRPDPGPSARRAARLGLVRRLKRERWGETMDEPSPSLALTVPDAVRLDMERKLILIEDVAQVIARAEATGAKLKTPETGRFVANHRIGEVTFWVDYAVADGGFVVARAWAHRMQVEAEP
ncbi:FAD-dependent oxidoreductase [Siculibacillus lacustris]|uniref:FAD-dependent oxidoreductase n=1 Tax=Siculibacillus lacustris TaxID=1549641 RepID=A0A4V2KT81_9HYPH|nr:pyridine nucleotide-disulfide oxidoreductase/dicluster-binding protein [Siculibacillus lacustris]TBW36128.1 FAD-dependent oxidoreductase [Siculibacillus lacustris]